MSRSDEWKYPNEINSIKLNPGDEETIFVSSIEYYSKNAFIVNEGEKYEFTVSPEERWKDWTIETDASGFCNIILRRKKHRLPLARCFVLCGTIGMNEEYHFRIGFHKTQMITKSGNLHFFANDKKDSRFANKNNKGKLALKVKRLL